MPTRLRENPYKGVNPHLQSWLQTPGTQFVSSKWPGFHTNHIGHIADFLNVNLPSNYVAHTEQSLQIRAEDFGTGEEAYSQRVPDVGIYQSGTSAGTAIRQQAPRVIPLEETLDLTEDFVPAVIIRQVPGDEPLGTVITRIELLSPSNLPGHTGYTTYRIGRADTLHAGVPLVEVDYIHELRPPMLKVPRYPRHPNSYPYNIYVSDPRPSIQKGHFMPYGFDVDEPFSHVRIPLAGDEFIEFDFGVAYHHTFERGRWGTYVDYEQLPARFETYSPADQERIKTKMAALAAIK
jgi:hypothetical protein